MNIDSLDIQGPVFRWKVQEAGFLRARDMGANDNLVPILNDVIDRYLQVGKRRREQCERVLCSLWSRRKAGRRRDVDPGLSQNSVERRWIVVREGIVPEHDDLLVSTRVVRPGGTPEEGSE